MKLKKVGLFILCIFLAIALWACARNNSSENIEETKTTEESRVDKEDSKAKTEEITDPKDTSEDSTNEKLSIKDKDGKEIADFTKKSEFENIAKNLLGDVSTEDELKAKIKEAKVVRKLPKDAEVSYEYSVELDPSRDLEVQKVDFVVYKNYPYITIKDLPIFGNMNFEIPNDVYEKIANPENLTK